MKSMQINHDMNVIVKPAQTNYLSAVVTFMSGLPKSALVIPPTCNTDIHGIVTAILPSMDATINLTWHNGEIVAVSITTSVELSTLSLSNLDDLSDEVARTLRAKGLNPPRFFSTPIVQGSTLILTD